MSNGKADAGSGGPSSLGGTPFADVDVGGAAAPEYAPASAAHDIVADEGGEQAVATNTPAADNGVIGTIGDDSSDTPSLADGASVTGAETLSLEVTLLSLDAVDRVAAGIAQRVGKAIKGEAFKGVVLADPAAVNALRLRALLMGEVESLEATVASVTSAVGERESAFGADDVLAPLRAVRQAANLVTTTLAWFQVTSDYRGKADLVRPSALAAALAKHVSALGIEARVPKYAIAPPSGRGLVERALAVQLKCRDLQAAGIGGPQIDNAMLVVSSLLQALFGASMTAGEAAASPVAGLAQQLAEADVTAAALADGYALLTVELAIAAGSYRAKKWILNALLGRDGLTYNGGAAATFFLLASDRMTALASDTIYFATGHGQFRGPPTHFRSSNI